MDLKVSPIELESVVNTHQKPFIVIDKNYHIIAANQNYKKVYGYLNEAAIGRKCYEAIHGRDRPCAQDGESCPHEHVFATGEASVCTHFHSDINGRRRQVKLSAYPLRAADGGLYIGECIEEISSPEDRRRGGVRMVGEAPAFLACLKQLEIAASSEAPVLLTGETGTGKELAAEFIHSHSKRANNPFQIVDSSVLTKNLFEMEMFGHARDVFTSSVGDKQGLFELAEGGSVFLDEIGDLPLSQQSKLLRVLESGQYRPIGGKKTSKANVRIICATNQRLWESVQNGSFREDLYYRIACLNIQMPALRDRIDDVPTLARNLVEGINRSMRSSYHLHADVYDELKRYKYPGNVRELRNVLLIAATHCHDREINAELIRAVFSALPQTHRDAAAVAEYAQTARPTPPLSSQTPTSLKDVETAHIKSLLERFDGNRKKVADSLGISERTIYRKLKKLGIR